jgi:hypothetical protein
MVDLRRDGQGLIDLVSVAGRVEQVVNLPLVLR